MTTAVEINGVTLVPIKEAASAVSYSRDYVARLAREGKIVASQVGRQWFVDLPSLQNFAAAADAVEEVRKNELRAERKRELMAKEYLGTLDEVVKKRLQKERKEALLVTCAVVCIGLFTGAGFYAALPASHSKLAMITESLTTLEATAPASTAVSVVSPRTRAEESPFRVMKDAEAALVETTVVERPVFTDESEVERFGAEMEGVVLLSRDTTVRDAASVAALFSDDVEVVFVDEAETMGVVRYDQGEGGTVLEYPFVTVPGAVVPEESAEADEIGVPPTDKS